MGLIRKLIEADRAAPKRILVVGDAMIDSYVTGAVSYSQDGCLKLSDTDACRVPGGAANAARQFANWPSTATLCSPAGVGEDFHFLADRAWGYAANLMVKGGSPPSKQRFVTPDGRVLLRWDVEAPGYGLTPDQRAESRKALVAALREGRYDAVLFSDYDKGWLADYALREAVGVGRLLGIPVVADAKREAHIYAGAVLKCNEDYAKAKTPLVANDGLEGLVVTRGARPPVVRREELAGDWPSVMCVNHVGAGDCFAAHLTLALAHGFDLADAARVAHHAGRVYVRHRHNRPPWPHEVRKDHDPVGGKVVVFSDLPALRGAAPGRVVYANGVFRLPHAGHCAMLEWARRQGDVLVVGVNDDGGAAAARPGEFCLPLADRAYWLASLSCVDWVVPFDGLTPENHVEALLPDVLVKGEEYRGKFIPGQGHTKEIRFAPMRGDTHAAEIVKAVKGHKGW